MTLHDTTILLKKAGIGSAVGITSIILIVILVRVSMGIYASLNPPLKDPPKQSFGALPPIEFPKNVADNNFTYKLETTSGGLPTTLTDGSTPIPDRLSVFPIVESSPNFQNLDIAKSKVASLNFTVSGGGALPEKQLEDPYYEWDETTGFNRKIKMNINSFDFTMTSDFLSSLIPLSGQFISSEPSAIQVAQNFLSIGGFTTKDLDFTKTSTPDNPVHYVTYPKLYSIQSGPQGNTLVETTSLSKTQVIRVDFYQNDVVYDMNTGGTEGAGQKVHLKIPIIYPHPPFSIMNFLVTSGPNGAMVTQAFYTHKNIDLTNADATYAIKTADEAFTELKNGKAYIAAYYGTDNIIPIKSVYLAYYLGEDSEGYLKPIYVFEGNNGFFAYVPALAN